MISALGYFSYKHRFAIEDMVREEDKHTNVSESNDATSMPSVPKRLHNIEVPTNDSLKNQINYLLKSSEIYRQKELRIHDLSLLLNTNRTYLSQVIKEDFDSDFSDLINRYRTQYAAKLLETDAAENAMSMDEVASRSGFSSKSSFFRVFKANMGVSPGKYKANMN